LLAAYESGQLSYQEKLSIQLSLKEAYEKDIRKLGHRRQWEQALALFREMAKKRMEQDSQAYGSAIQACSEKVKQWQRAVSLITELRARGLTPRVESFGWATASCARAREWRKALGVLQDMQQSDVTPDEMTLRNALHVCRGGLFWAEALSFLSEMESREDIEANKGDYNEVMDTCEYAGEDDWYDYVEELAAQRGFEMRV